VLNNAAFLRSIYLDKRLSLKKYYGNSGDSFDKSAVVFWYEYFTAASTPNVRLISSLLLLKNGCN
jgi:hypothetical protein